MSLGETIISYAMPNGCLKSEWTMLEHKLKDDKLTLLYSMKLALCSAGSFKKKKYGKLGAAGSLLIDCNIGRQIKSMKRTLARLLEPKIQH